MKRPVKLSDILSDITDNLKIRADCKELHEMWSEIVGGQVAKHTKPVTVQEKILIVHVDSSAWLHHLFMLKNEVLKTIAKKIPGIDIRDIRMTTRDA